MRGACHPDDLVVLQLAGRATDEDAAEPQLVVPLVAGEVVDTGAAGAEVEGGDRRRRGLRLGRAGPAGPVQRVEQRGLEAHRPHRDRPRPHAQQPADQRHRVVLVRRGHLHLRGRPDRAGRDHRRPRRVGGHQQVLLGHLHQARCADVCPQRAQPLDVRRRRCLGEDRHTGRHQLADDVRGDRPRQRRDHEVGLRPVEALRHRPVRRHRQLARRTHDRADALQRRQLPRRDARRTPPASRRRRSRRSSAGQPPSGRYSGLPPVTASTSPVM